MADGSKNKNFSKIIHAVHTYFYMNCVIRFFNEDFKNIGKEFISIVIKNFNDVINFE